jgi:hypothetical protein
LKNAKRELSAAQAAGLGTGGPADAQIEHSRSKARPAQRRDAPVTCAHCSRSVRRKSRQQRFCGRKCRVSAHRAKTAIRPLKIHSRYPHSGDETKVRKKAKDSNGLRDRFSRSTPRISGPASVIEAEVYAGRNWQRVVSSDGVEVEIAWLRPRALRETGE